MIRRWWVAVIFLCSLRLAHINLLWSDEDYHLAAAIQLLKGHWPYRDFWYDKPPLAAVFYMLAGGYPGWPLRILDVLFVIACCWFAYRLARAWWGENEGRIAALLLAFFTTFYLTPATIPFAVDGLLLLPHLAAVYFAFVKQPLLSGICCALGLLTNIKAVFIVATCAWWLQQDLPAFATGLLAPLALAFGLSLRLQLLPDAYRQIWQWGLIYTAVPSSIGTAARRCADWLGFHAALLAGILAARPDARFQLGAWFICSAAPLFLGNQFAPRYFYQILPVMVIAASRGIVLATQQFGRTAIATLGILLLIPAIRFGPRYGELIRDNIQHRQTRWSDAALDIDSQQVANWINANKQARDTLFVWGYRPDIYVYTRLTPPGKFSDSQPLDGVPADRHLFSSNPSRGIPAKANRMQLIETSPTFIVDGLGSLNAQLRPDRYAELRRWLQRYQVVAKTHLSTIYARTKK